MRTLLAALAYCTGVGLAAAGAAQIPAGAAPLALLVLVGCALFGRRDRPGRDVALWVAAGAAGLLRGLLGTPVEPSWPRGRPDLLDVRVVAASEPGSSCAVAIDGGVVLRTAVGGCPAARGDRLLVPRSALPGAVGPDLPGAETGARSRLVVERAYVAARGGAVDSAFVAQARAEAFARSRGDPALALALAAALGLSVALSPDEREALRKAGLSHLIAVSGLNVAVAAMLAWTGVLRVAAWLGRSPRAAVLLSWVPVVGYVALTGAAPSAVRAAVMLALLGLGVAVGRPVHGLCSLCVAAAVILTAVPEWAVDPGFQMSLGAMGALVTAPPRAGILAQSWRVGWVVAPLSWFHFGQASPWGLLSNVVAIPLFSFWILPTALLGWSLTPWLGDIALAPAATGARIVLDLARVVARLPQPEGRAVELAAVLAVAATLGAWAGLSWLRVWARRAWLPPILASAGLLAAVRGKGPSAEDGHWYAVGGPRVASLVAPGGPGRACLRGAGLSPDRWRDLLDELGITEVGLEAAGGDPRLAELRERLASRLTELDPGACAWPDEAAARRALARCLERSGGRRGIVRGRVGAPEIECFAGGGWKPLVGSGRR